MWLLKSPQFIWLLILSLATQSAAAFSKKEAYDKLLNSDKWKLVDTLVPEAEEKSAEVEASMRPRTGLVFTQFLARTNPIQYGVTAGAAPITTLGFGSTGIETEWTIMDPLSKAKLLLYKSKEQFSANQAADYHKELIAVMLLEYLNVQKLKRQLELMEVSLERSQLIERLTLSKQRIGAGIQSEVVRARNLVRLDQIKKMNIKTKFLKAKNDLQSLLGLSEWPADLDPYEAHMKAFQKYPEVLKQALNDRSDLNSAKRAISSAQEAQAYSQKLIFPKLSLLAQVGSTDTSMLGLGGQTLTGWIGVNLLIPLDSGGLIEAKRKESLVMANKAELALRDKVSEVTGQVKESLENLALADEALKAAQEFVESSQAELDLASRKYSAGGSSALEVSTAHTNLATANDNLNETVFAYEAARIAYYKALGDFSGYFEVAKKP